MGLRNEVAVRIRISPHLMKRYKILCLHLDLSVAKQTESLVRQFVEAQESYIAQIQDAKRNITSTPKS